MRQARAPLVARCSVQVQPERLAWHQHNRAVGKRAHAQFGALQVSQDADRAAGLLLQRAQCLEALTVVSMAAMAEVEPEHVNTGHEQPAHGLRVGAGRA